MPIKKEKETGKKQSGKQHIRRPFIFAGPGEAAARARKKEIFENYEEQIPVKKKHESGERNFGGKSTVKKTSANSRVKPLMLKKVPEKTKFLPGKKKHIVLGALLFGGFCTTVGRRGGTTEWYKG